ncbi:MAG: M48 family metallopeptidase, partial [Myxococcales bacterium]|nr:M48 family metallopeptidase [Myxococcales bacterium]
MAASLARRQWLLPALGLLALGLLLWLSISPVEAAPPEAGSAGGELPAIEIDAQGYVVVPTPSEQAMSWYRSGNILWIINLAWGLLIPALFVFTGFSARLRDWTGELGKKPILGVLGFLLVYALLSFVIDLPLSYYGGFARPHAYGLSSQSAGKWFGDELKGLMLGVVALWLFVPGTLWFVRKSPDRWWIWTSMVAVPIAFLLLMLAPVFISPLFNDFGPMKDAGLEAEILALAERAGIEGSRVFEVDKSVDTNTVNAYVTGFGATKRIVLWDTIIARLGRDELLVVMGHEMGHYVLGHVRNSMMLAAVSIPLTLWLFHKVAGLVIARHRERLGFASLGDVAALPLFFLLTGLFGFVIAPLGNAWSRHQEHESDRFALEITHDNQACARAFARLQQTNLGNPRPGTLWV